MGAPKVNVDRDQELIFRCPRSIHNGGRGARKRIRSMTTKMRYFLLLAAMAPALLNAQVLRIVSYRCDPSGNNSLTFTNYPRTLYGGLLAARSADDDFWLPVAWNALITNSTTTFQFHTSPPKSFFRLVCSTNRLSLPSLPRFQVPSANITVDGNSSDWSGIQPAVTDRAGDAYGGPSGSDITALYLARDSTKAYLRIDVTNGPPDGSLSFSVSFYTNYFPAYAGDRFVDISIHDLSCAVKQYTSSNCGGCWTNVVTGTLAVQGNVIEASVPLSALNPPSPCYVRAYQEFDSTAIVEATFR
jgi:hypothetical protein